MSTISRQFHFDAVGDRVRLNSVKVGNGQLTVGCRVKLGFRLVANGVPSQLDLGSSSECKGKTLHLTVMVGQSNPSTTHANCSVVLSSGASTKQYDLNGTVSSGASTTFNFSIQLV